MSFLCSCVVRSMTLLPERHSSAVTTTNKLRHGDSGSILFVRGSYIPCSCLYLRRCTSHGNRDTCNIEHADISGTVPDRHHLFRLHLQQVCKDGKSRPLIDSGGHDVHTFFGWT